MTVLIIKSLNQIFVSFRQIMPVLFYYGFQILHQIYLSFSMSVSASNLLSYKLLYIHAWLNYTNLYLKAKDFSCLFFIHCLLNDRNHTKIDSQIFINRFMQLFLLTLIGLNHMTWTIYYECKKLLGFFFSLFYFSCHLIFTKKKEYFLCLRMFVWLHQKYLILALQLSL